MVKADLRAAKAGTGPTVFDWLTGILDEHGKLRLAQRYRGSGAGQGSSTRLLNRFLLADDALGLLDRVENIRSWRWLGVAAPGRAAERMCATRRSTAAQGGRRQ